MPSIIADSNVSYALHEPKKKNDKNLCMKPYVLGISVVTMTALCIALVLATSLIETSGGGTVAQMGGEKISDAVSADDDEEWTTKQPTDKATETSTRNETSQPTVEVGCARIEGMRADNGAIVFKGVPYAEPPTRELRWKPPQPSKYWSSAACKNGTTLINATKFGEKCVQKDYTNGVEGSEDCLFLNVWTPTLNSSANLPVAVYVHGGSLISLSGNIPTLSPNEFITKQLNIVFVSMNYRLNAFGFMALDLLSENSTTNTSGNYGFSDQILSLEWVKQNIAKFGGDPNSVTLFGHSSGGTSIFALLAAPRAEGLFQRAWIASGSPILNKTLEEASRINLKYLNNTGCTDINCLYALTKEEVIGAVPWSEYPSWAVEDLLELPIKGHFNGPVAIADGEVIPRPPLDSWTENKTQIHVPVLIGTTSHEADFVGITIRNWTDYVDEVRQRLDSFGENVSFAAMNQYPPDTKYDPVFLYTSMVSDLRETCPVRKQATIMNMASTEPVYRYVVTAQPSKPVSYFGLPHKPKYAFHGIDMLALFGTFTQYLGSPSPGDEAFQSNVQNEILNFFRTGKMYESTWEEFPASTALLSENTTFVIDYHKEQCDFWEDNGFFSYAWIN